jgi:hypothetical protein
MLICRLLIWEECHYEPTSCSVPPSTSGTENLALPFGEWEGHFGPDVHSSQLGIQAGGRLCSLINKMMVNNQVNIVGEGYVFLPFHVPYILVSHYDCLLCTIESLICYFSRIVGRVAFTGNHEWILANNYSKDAHPPEVRDISFHPVLWNNVLH